ncbi:hypothetical protein F5Y12DRAFT_794110 [Xylaria sp. FL1777]|nr:hypothetical protein F5Y12DRAFT_794110 [Xylaria sp. FL1777]
MKPKIVKITTWPFRAICQVWNDFKRGRQVRKDQEHKQEMQEEQTEFPETEQSHGETSQSLVSRQNRSTGLQRRNPKQQGWKRQRGEYPWRIEQLVHLDDNTRGTWVLEAKDMSAIVWEKEYRMKGSRLKTETVPQPHWPFPSHLQHNDVAKRDPDELLNWLSHSRSVEEA